MTTQQEAVDPQSILEVYGITDSDLQTIRTIGETITPQLDALVESFYAWLAPRPEFEQFFSNAGVLARVKLLQKQYWAEFFQATIDADYIGRRKRVGEVHARVQLSADIYLTAVNYSINWFSDRLSEIDLSPTDHLQAYQALTKLVNMESSIVIEMFSRRSAEIIRDQTKTMLELSTPVIGVWENVLILPMIGTLDSLRMQEAMEKALVKLSEDRAQVLIVDITGVPVMDTMVANHLIRLASAVRLMGGNCILTGISPDTARTIVQLGIDLEQTATRSTLAQGLKAAIALVNSNGRRNGDGHVKEA